MHLNTWARMLALCAGGLDLASGLGLILLPAFTLRTMGVAVPGGEALGYVRFIGAFVVAVGVTYLWALLFPWKRLRAVLGLTLIFRAATGGYAAVAVLCGSLDAGWLLVSVADFALFMLQAWLLAKGAYRDA